MLELQENDHESALKYLKEITLKGKMGTIHTCYF